MTEWKKIKEHRPPNERGEIRVCSNTDILGLELD